MSIPHSYSLLRISYALMSPYCSGTDRVVIGWIWVCQCMCKWTWSQRMGKRLRILHAGGQRLWCGSGLWSLIRMRKSNKITETIYLMVQKFWSNLWCDGLTQTGLFVKTRTSHQCLLLNNCGSVDSASLALSRQHRGNFRWRTCLTWSSRIGDILVDSGLCR